MEKKQYLLFRSTRQELRRRSSSASIMLLKDIMPNVRAKAPDTYIVEGLLNPANHTDQPKQVRSGIQESRDNRLPSCHVDGIIIKRHTGQAIKELKLPNNAYYPALSLDNVQDRAAFLGDYNRLAKRHDVQFIILAEHQELDATSTVGTARRGSWLTRKLLRRASSGQSVPSTTQNKLKHKRSISDTFSRIHKGASHKKTLQELVLLCGISAFSLPAEYAPELLSVPTCLRATAQYLLQHSTAPGIFRVPGSHNSINALYDFYTGLDHNDGTLFGTVCRPTLPLHIQYNVYDVASTFKKLLAGLPGGILGSTTLYKAFLSIYIQFRGDPEWTRTRRSRIRARLLALAIATVRSKYQRELICAVFGLLCLIGRKAEIAPNEDDHGQPLTRYGLMGYSALGVVFGPLLLGDELQPSKVYIADLQSQPSEATKLAKVRKDRNRKSTTVGASDGLKKEVDCLKIASNIVEMLITNWRDVVRQMKDVGAMRTYIVDHGPLNAISNGARSSPSGSRSVREALKPFKTSHMSYRNDSMVSLIHDLSYSSSNASLIPMFSTPYSVRTKEMSSDKLESSCRPSSSRYAEKSHPTEEKVSQSQLGLGSDMGSCSTLRELGGSHGRVTLRPLHQDHGFSGASISSITHSISPGTIPTAGSDIPNEDILVSNATLPQPNYDEVQEFPSRSCGDSSSTAVCISSSLAHGESNIGNLLLHHSSPPERILTTDNPLRQLESEAVDEKKTLKTSKSQYINSVFCDQPWNNHSSAKRANRPLLAHSSQRTTPSTIQTYEEDSSGHVHSELTLHLDCSVVPEHASLNSPSLENVATSAVSMSANRQSSIEPHRYREHDVDDENGNLVIPTNATESMDSVGTNLRVSLHMKKRSRHALSSIDGKDEQLLSSYTDEYSPALGASLKPVQSPRSPQPIEHLETGKNTINQAPSNSDDTSLSASMHFRTKSMDISSAPYCQTRSGGGSPTRSHEDLTQDMALVNRQGDFDSDALTDHTNFPGGKVGTVLSLLNKASPVATFIQTRTSLGYRSSPSKSEVQLLEPTSGSTSRPTSSSLYCQVRILQCERDRYKQEAQVLRQQLEARETLSELGTISELLRETKNELELWKDRAQTAEKGLQLVRKVNQLANDRK